MSTQIEKSVKPTVLALLKFAREQEEKLVARLSKEEREEQGTEEKWAAKDYVVNILRWKQLQTEKLATAQSGGVPPVWHDMELVHRINSEAFAQYRDRSFE